MIDVLLAIAVSVAVIFAVLFVVFPAVVVASIWAENTNRNPIEWYVSFICWVAESAESRWGRWD